MGAWNDWYHVCGNTYGTWLPGDPRGHSTRHGREQRAIADHLEKSEGLLVREAVRLGVEARGVVLGRMGEALQYHQIEVVICSVDDHHFHLLGRVPDRRPRK